MSTSLLREWLRAGLVHSEALICEVGQQAWRALDDASALLVRPERPSRFDPSKERCLLDIEPVPHDTAPPLSAEHLVAGAAPPLESGPPPPDLDGEGPSEVTRVEVPRPLRVAARRK